jgi:hypothetical protein
MTNLKALVLAIFAHITPGADRAAEPAVVSAIVTVGDEATTEEIALLTVYAWKESMAQANPRPWSWDAKAQKSCSVWQEPCSFTRTHSLVEQARWWLDSVRRAGLASVDSSPKRARVRTELAMSILKQVQVQ